MSEILPCPFCGYVEVTLMPEGLVFCDNCTAQAPTAKVWNRRPLPPGQAVVQEPVDTSGAVVERATWVKPGSPMGWAILYLDGIAGVFQDEATARHEKERRDTAYGPEDRELIPLYPLAPQAPAAPVAWMWQYIGNDPMADQIKPCARSLHEMDPHKPPYPDKWRPEYPLYSVAAPPAPTLEGVEELVKKWRNSFAARPSTEDYYRKDYNDAAHSDDIAKTIRDMADELEAELRHITPMQEGKVDQGKFDALERQYNELLFAVGTKHKDESRHATALRYIRTAEENRLSSATEEKRHE